MTRRPRERADVTVAGRLNERWQLFEHRWVHNGPLWVLCPGCWGLRFTPDYVAPLDHRATPEQAWFWWSQDQLSQPWKLWLWGSDEWGRRDLGIRLPGGMLFIGLWRFPEFRGPCQRCGRWEHEDAWDGEHCQHCAWELRDYERGCICPSLLDDDWEIDDWPAEDCEVHAHLGRA